MMDMLSSMMASTKQETPCGGIRLEAREANMRIIEVLRTLEEPTTSKLFQETNIKNTQILQHVGYLLKMGLLSIVKVENKVRTYEYVFSQPITLFDFVENHLDKVKAIALYWRRFTFDDFHVLGISDDKIEFLFKKWVEDRNLLYLGNGEYRLADEAAPDRVYSVLAYNPNKSMTKEEVAAAAGVSVEQARNALYPISQQTLETYKRNFPYVHKTVSKIAQKVKVNKDIHRSSYPTTFKFKVPDDDKYYSTFMPTS